MTTEGLTIEARGQVLQIGIATADGRNEMTDAMLAALTARVREPGAGIAAIVLHAQGADFCTGRAVSLPPPLPEGADLRTVLRTRGTAPILSLYEALRASEVPVACFVQGLASGLGCAVVAACDHVVATTDSRFDAPELEKQFTPGLLMSALAARVHPKAIARLVLTMQPIDAATALSVGLVGELVAPGRLDSAREAFVALLNSRAPLALAGIKRFLREAPGLASEGLAALAADVTSHTLAARSQPFEPHAPQATTRRIAIGDEQIAYDDQGSGPPLVLLHSLGTSGALWRAALPRLVRSHRVIRVDARGHGGSTNHGGYRPDAVARDVIALADRLQLGRFALAGISMGGLTAARVAAEAGDRISALVLSSAYASAAGPSAEQRIEMVERMLERVPMAAFARTYVEQTLARDTPFELRESIAGLIAGVAKQDYLETLRAIGRDDVSPLLAEIDTACLVLNAEVDPSVPAAASERLVQGIRGAVRAVVPGSRHLACVDAPEAYADALCDFLAQHCTAS